MHPVLKKLQYKGQDPILVLSAPEEYAPVLKGCSARVDGAPRGKYEFVQLFARTEADLLRALGAAIAALEGDALFWICYPKGTSKKYKSDLSREGIRQIASSRGFEGVAMVTMVAIDGDWSALRVRAADKVKKASSS